MRLREFGLAFALVLTAALVLSCGGTGSDSTSEISPPIAARIAHVDTVHGDVRSDDYFWLRERENPDVIAYLEAENEYSKQVMSHTEGFQDSLYKEMRARIKETDLSVPARKGDYYYYSREEEGKQYEVYCRKKGSLDAQEEVLLDVNVIAEGHDYCYLGTYSVSPDHSILAYSIDTTGREKYALYFKDIAGGTLLPDTIIDIDYRAVWANDNNTIFYTTVDETLRPDKLWRHTLNTPQSDDKMIYHEEDQAFGLWINKTRSDQYILLELWSMITSEVRFLDADNPTSDFRIVHPRQHSMEYSLSHRGDKFFFKTNDDAINFKVMEAPVADPSKDNWAEVIAHRDSVMIMEINLFENHMVVLERENGLRQLRIIDLRDNSEHYVEFPDPVYTVSGDENLEFATNMYRFSYTSFITPRSIYDYDMVAKTRELKKQDEVVGGYDPDLYKTERLFAKADDGASVPISLVYRKDTPLDGSSPLLMHGYGAYGYSTEPRFRSRMLSVLDRGMSYAIAHVRGGSELGRLWYEDGKMLNKKNTFTDFIACAEHLINEKYTSSEGLVIGGGSAGGLLIGAVVNMRPDLFKAAIADVPFVDVINTMLDETIPLTVVEYEEWGNPNEKEYYDYMLSYSPYDNVVAKEYPNLLILAGLNDPRVQYWEPAKYAAKLRALKTDDNLLLLKTNMGSGHFGATGRYDYLKEFAYELAFIFDAVGISQ